MAVLAMVLSGAVLVFCGVIFAHRLTRGPEERRRATAYSDGGETTWLSAAVGDGSSSDCSAADAGAGCDGGGGGD